MVCQNVSRRCLQWSCTQNRGPPSHAFRACDGPPPMGGQKHPDEGGASFNFGSHRGGNAVLGNSVLSRAPVSPLITSSSSFRREHAPAGSDGSPPAMLRRSASSGALLVPAKAVEQEGEALDFKASAKMLQDASEAVGRHLTRQKPMR